MPLVQHHTADKSNRKYSVYGWVRLHFSSFGAIKKLRIHTAHIHLYFFRFMDSLVLVPVNVYRSLCCAPIALTRHSLSCIMWIFKERSGLRFNIYQDTSTIFTVTESICILWMILKVEAFDALFLLISHIFFSSPFDWKSTRTNCFARAHSHCRCTWIWYTFRGFILSTFRGFISRRGKTT